ncbi:Panacea domain-containing protein [Sphingobium fuliginis]|uniref:Panacea domain-containing protein n=1 Tax=Sphingobium fuliginis (strain ATCC 27551) TaxID=336203 RepID=UPI000C085EEE|nr:Panacea domain-containing protein [Sphingobium fuliginis]
MMAHALRFQFNESKGVEALAYIAQKWSGITAFYASKVLFFAEKKHLNRYSRPIVGDTFIAMPNGPVPSTLYDFIKGKLDHAGDPDAIMRALLIQRDPYPRIDAHRPADQEVLSPSDIECLEEAISFCRGKSFSSLSGITHQEKAWLDAPQNGPMDYADLIDGDDQEEILAEAAEFAAYGVL